MYSHAEQFCFICHDQYQEGKVNVNNVQAQYVGKVSMTVKGV